MTTQPNRTQVNLIAPCGIDCRLCRAYGRERNPCPGCRAGLRFQSDDAVHCSVRCAILAAQTFRFCFECRDYPCKRLVHLDHRYRTRYATSPLDNLEQIRSGGIHQFVRDESEKWLCPACGALLCMHDPECPACGHRWHSEGGE